jgi:hypothetical protein
MRNLADGQSHFEFFQFWLALCAGCFFAPLSLALSRKGRGDVLFKSNESFQLGDTNKLPDYIGS